MKNYAVVIKLTGEILENSLLAWDILNKKFKVRYISSRSPFPHITLSAGQCHVLENVFKEVKEAAAEYSPFEIHSNGLGVFVKKSPVIYIRWTHSKQLYNLFNFLENSFKKTWEKPEKNFQSEYWLAKTTLAYSDVSYSDLPFVLEFLRTIDFEKQMVAEGLSLVEYDKEGERELQTFYF